MPSAKHILSKSDFKLASDCPQKLLYKKAKYPTTNEGNEYLQMLAEGGYIVGKMAQLLYPEGIEITTEKGTEDAIRKTHELLMHNKEIILFEAAIQSGNKIVRIDILKKSGNKFEILEVKAKSWNSDGDNEEDKPNISDQKKKLKEYIEDVAYQTLVLREYLDVNFKKATIVSKLLMPDKSKRTQIDNLISWFSITEKTKNKDFNNVVVEFNQTGKEAALWEGDKKSCILQEMDVTSEIYAIPEPPKKKKEGEDEVVKSIYQTVEEKTCSFLEILKKKKIEERGKLITKNCFKCEFRATKNDNRDGYAECLGKRAYAENHISELYYGGDLGGRGEKGLINKKLGVNKELTIFDFNIEDFKTTKNEIGSRNIRQIIQYNNTKTNKEFFSDEMRKELKTWKYPLHFIDFETYTGAIPMHKGMQPYELVAFQWSLHVIEKPGEAPKHFEWINEDLEFPNFRFAESLMKAIGTKGTPLMWATHENTVLKKILEQLENADNYLKGYKNDKLKKWLAEITREKVGDKIIRAGRLIDMNAFTLKHYFHPYMKGKTSIKKTLPAIWNHNKYLHNIDYFKKYFKKENGIILNPYETLKYHWDNKEYEIAEINETVKEGSAAMRAYQEMLFGKGRKDEKTRERLKKELLNYCELDTMAMVIIWKHWVTKTAP